MSRFDHPRRDSEPANIPSLFDHGMAPVIHPVPSSSSIEANFDLFHQANPFVYRSLVKLARDLHRRGHRKVGMKMLFEVLRWQWSMATADPASEFKLNNNYTSRYARLIMDNEPDLAGIFEVRKLTAA